MILYVASATALSYGHPFLLNDLSILNVFNTSSITLFLNSFPLSVWNIFILFKLYFILLNALYTKSAVLCFPAAYPIISRLNKSIIKHIRWLWP